jgi:hypothetical protein
LSAAADKDGALGLQVLTDFKRKLEEKDEEKA